MTPTAAVRSILGDPSGTLSEARCREVVVAVLRACREPSFLMLDRFYAVEPYDEQDPALGGFPAMIEALIEEVTAEAGR